MINLFRCTKVSLIVAHHDDVGTPYIEEHLNTVNATIRTPLGYVYIGALVLFVNEALVHMLSHTSTKLKSKWSNLKKKKFKQKHIDVVVVN